MKLKLFAPASSLNWLLLAEELRDPADWSVFLLNHGPDTDRYGFETAVQKVSAENNVLLTSYRLGCKRGVCALEYSWDTEPAAVKAQALRVAEFLSTDIELPEATLASQRLG